jgi:cytochrome c-type biogenesis protein CcmF
VIRLIGHSATLFCLGAAVYGMIAAFWGMRTKRQDILATVRTAAYATFGLMLVANLAMVYALVTKDFSISYVAQVGSHATPNLIAVISLWSALEGSILFWGLVLSFCAAAVAWLHRSERSDMFVATNAVMLFVGAFFYMLMVGPANPFGAVSPVPMDGPGPNPLLQNHWLMAVHPPLLYFGYVGLTVPFAFAIGALMTRQTDERWLWLTRRWLLTAWAFLTAGIVAGMWWSYEVLGWGGYWAWDPVENASFLPWLTATAFIHSAMVQERRGMLKTWNVTLIIATFLLTILGTFLTRSGILTSVHAFAGGDIGYYFLAFMGVTLLGSLALVAGRSEELKTAGNIDSPASRETVFVLNNLVLAAFTFTVLLGTLFPLVAEAARGVRVTVGEPFFNRMTLPLVVMLLFLMGVGPALPWGRAKAEHYRKLIVPAIVAVVAGVIPALMGANFLAILAFAFTGFALTVNTGEFLRGTGARRKALGENHLLALGRLVKTNPRRFGGFTAHIGVLIMALGIAASSTFTLDHEVTLEPGEMATVGTYTVRFDDIWGQQEPHRFVVASQLAIFKNDRRIGTLEPRLNYYAMSDQPITTPAVRSRAHEDLYITLLAFERDGSSVTLRVLVEPLLAWIWVGGGIMFLGAGIAFTYRGPKGGKRTPRGPVPAAKAGKRGRREQELVEKEGVPV